MKDEKYFFIQDLGKSTVLLCIYVCANCVTKAGCSIILSYNHICKPSSLAKECLHIYKREREKNRPELLFVCL